MNSVTYQCPFVVLLLPIFALLILVCLKYPVSTDGYNSVWSGTGCLFLCFHCQMGIKGYQEGGATHTAVR